MTTVTFSERLAEAAGPIVVKEVRQGLRAKVFAIFFGLLLLGCLVVALVAAAEFDRSRSVDLGPDYFRLFLGALAIVEYFVIPYMAFRAMAREREDETWVLLVLTGLGARRIVRGKVSSALAQGLLYASACAPFVLFSYYLNGIDLPTVLVALVMAAAWSCLLVCVGVGAATQAHSRLGRALVHFVVLAVLLGGTAAGIAFSAFFAEEGGRLLREQVGFRVFCVAHVAFCVTTAWVASEGAASGLALLSENAAKGPRLALSLQVLLATVVAGISAVVVDHGDKVASSVGSVGSALYLCLAGLFAVSEHDGFPPAFARTRRWFKPGALRSFTMLVLLLMSSTAVWFAIYVAFSGGREAKYERIVLAPPLFVVLYLSLGVLLGRLTPLRGLGEPIATRTGFALAVVLGTAVPMFLSVMTGHHAEYKELNVLSPLLGIASINGGARGERVMILAGVSALLFGFLAYTTLSSRDVERRS
ncbi:MAG: ABC transporter permease [Myxococcaceae bacterium]|nr:ABC transporter permease [Myxococcaceae bacterium]